MDTGVRDYGQDQELAKQFLQDFTYVSDAGDVVPKYKDMLEKLANREEIHLFVELADVEKFNPDLARQVTGNTYRYSQIFMDALDEILPSYKTRESADLDTMDVFIQQRLFISERNQRAQPATSTTNTTNTTPMGPQKIATSNRQGTIDIEGKYPPDLIRRAEVSFKPATQEYVPIRSVQAESIGHLITIRGIVTRTTDVKPKITVVTYTCDQCGCETFQPVRGSDFMPLFECTSSVCQSNKALGRLTMQTRGSKFIKFQEIKLQENSDQVPTGHIPRTITVYAHGELTRLCAPGDHISVTGVFLPIMKSGYRMRTGGLTADTYVEAHYIVKMNKTEDDELSSEPMSAQEAIDLIQGGDNFLSKLSRSIAPEIYGQEDLKKALLLLLVGGVDISPKGMRIRGNINICLMGDPGVAKSQLLSFIDRLATRSQYTTGRGSSGVGLTAAVLKDPITNELVLEGGALVLADEGICCIDEFDKMMDADRTAIHEVMEQQTVSIAKAGIMTTLNARVSILAAANPAYGRYNVHKTITDNLDLPPALLSRFDLLWLIRDRPDEQKDLNLAQHVTNIHTNPNDLPELDFEPIPIKDIRRYINLCKRKNPIIPTELDERLEDIYLDIRSRKRRNCGGDSLFTSPRSLLAIIRLATALARLRLADTVEKGDIDMAVYLYNCSRESIEGARSEFDGPGNKILKLLDRMSKASQNRSVQLDKLYEKAESQGLKREQVYEALVNLAQIDSLSFDDYEVTLIG